MTQGKREYPKKSNTGYHAPLFKVLNQVLTTWVRNVYENLKIIYKLFHENMQFYALSRLFYVKKPRTIQLTLNNMGLNYTGPLIHDFFQ